MDTFKDNQAKGETQDAQDSAPDFNVEQQAGANIDPNIDQSRRRFAGAALASGAVLVSLGSRSAWGAGGTVVGCMSVMTLNSFNPETGMFTSSPAGRPSHNEDLARQIHQLGRSPDYLGRQGRWRSCEHPYQANSVCLVRGKCPDTN